MRPLANVTAPCSRRRAIRSGCHIDADQPSRSLNRIAGSNRDGSYVPLSRPQAKPRIGSQRSWLPFAAGRGVALGAGVGSGAVDGLATGVEAGRAVGTGVRVGAGEVVASAATAGSRDPGSEARKRPPATTTATTTRTRNGPAIAGDARRREASGRRAAPAGGA